MLGPYEANNDGSISYRGNKLFNPIKNIESATFPIAEITDRIKQFCSDPMWGKIAKINHQINKSANDYFDGIGALFTALPLTTRMISSPGAVYGKEAIDYTSDTCPITLTWFEEEKPAFLSESSQIYLELALIQQGVDQVYSIYNSFRKEKADATHLSEFHHIEYEGKIGQPTNEKIALGLVEKIITDLLTYNEEDIALFLSKDKIKELKEFASSIKKIPRITFREALDVLYEDTKQEKYKRFTMKNFGQWEEIRLTHIFGNMVAVRRFPLLEVPFYHAYVDGVEERWVEDGKEKHSLVADNTDFIWPGYRETIGSGHRVGSISELEEKARVFNFPKEDYEPYLQTRRLPNYVETSGFGLGWERLLQGLLEMPYIWSSSQFPRGHTMLKP